MNRSGGKLTLVSVLVILLAVLLAALLAYLTPDSGLSSDGEWTPTVQEGRLPGLEDASVNNDGRYFFYQMGKEITFSKPTAPGSVLLENTPGNLYDMQVEYYSDDYGTVYLSPILTPGTHLLKDKLSLELEEGTYPVEAMVHVIDPDTGEEQDTFTENITLIVKNTLF